MNPPEAPPRPKRLGVPEKPRKRDVARRPKLIEVELERVERLERLFCELHAEFARLRERTPD